MSQKNREQIAFTGDPKFKRDLMKKPPTKKELKDLRKTRNSNVTWLDDRWIYDAVQPFVHAANKNADWNYSWVPIFGPLFGGAIAGIIYNFLG